MAKFELKGYYFILYFLISFSVEGAVLTVSPPQLVTVSPFEMATLRYEGTGNVLNLLVQNGPLTPAIRQQRNITVIDLSSSGNLSSVLTIVGLPVNDGVVIGCQVLSYPPPEQVFSGTTLKIKGVSSVEDLIHNFPMNNLLLIKWSAPVYYSNDVPFGSLFLYQVLVIDKEDGDIILDTNTTDSNITVANITECDTFNISVTALVNQYTSIDNTISNNGNYSITKYDTQPLIPSISFQLGCPPSRCLVSLMDGNTEVTDVINETEHIIEFKLSPFRHYELTAVVKNLRGKTRATYDTSISTFHTQDIIINSLYTNGSVSVQCVFVSGSTADGCHVIFNDTDQEIVESFTITGPGSTLVTVSASGVYDVYVYDIVNGSLYGPAVQDTTLVEIVEVIPSTSTSTSIISEDTSTETEMILFRSSSLTTLALVTVNPNDDYTISSSKDTNTMLLYAMSLVVGVMMLTIIVIIIVVTFFILQSKRRRNEVTEERIINNPAYAQVLHQAALNFPDYVNSQTSRVTVNPAYETVPFNNNDNRSNLVIYETVQ